MEASQERVERNRIICQEVLAGKTYREVGEAHGITHTRVKELYTLQLKKLSKQAPLSVEETEFIEAHGYGSPVSEQRANADKFMELFQRLWSNGSIEV